MTERLLQKKDIAAMLGTSPGVAASILAKRGVHPIDFGKGRSRGLRWLESAVVSTLREIHAAAQPQAKNTRPCTATRPASPGAHLAGMTIQDIHDLLTANQSVQ